MLTHITDEWRGGKPFILMQTTHFHKKGFAISHVLKARVFGTRKWPIFLSLPRSLLFFTVNSHNFTFSPTTPIVTLRKKGDHSRSNWVALSILRSRRCSHTCLIPLTCGMGNFLCFAGTNFGDQGRLLFLAVKWFLRFSESAMEKHIFKQYYGVHTLRKTSKILLFFVIRLRTSTVTIS